MRSECNSRPDCEKQGLPGEPRVDAPRMEETGPPGGCAFREGVGEQTGAVFCTWPARAGRHDPAVWTQPKEMLVGGVWLWSQDAELEVSPSAPTPHGTANKHCE